MRIPQNLGDHIIQGQVFVSKRRTVNNYVGLIAETGTIWNYQVRYIVILLKAVLQFGE